MRYSDHANFTRRGLRYCLLCASSLLLLVTCSFPGLPQRSGLTIVISAPAARTIVPQLDMNPAAYVISGSGPLGATFSTSITSGTSATISAIAAGAWTVAVNGMNAAGTFILQGSGTALVTTGTSSTLSVTVLPIAGPGSLSLAISWPAASVAAPSIQAQLVPTTGSATNLAFSAPLNGSSSSSDSGILNGYYTILIQLYDGPTLVAGAVDVAQIIQGQTTNGTYSFASVNSKGGITVNIAPNLLNPIAVTLSGQQASVGTGAAVTLNASVPAGTGNVTCAWYVNGVSTAIGASFTLNGATSALGPGAYRMDVTAFTSDGLRAGSATASMTVTNMLAVSLAWDASSATNLVGYRLYTGTAAGVYEVPTSLGLVTMATISNLVSGTTYYFALTAIDNSGQESAKSVEISYKAPS